MSSRVQSRPVVSGQTHPRVERRRPQLSNNLIAVLGLIVVAILWEYASSRRGSIVFPSASASFLGVFDILGDDDLRAQVLETIGRVIRGFLLGSMAGVVVGLAMGSVRFVSDFLEPYLNFFRFVTPIAWIAPASIWFGVGERTQTFMIVYATLFIVAINTTVGIRSVSVNKRRMALQFGARPAQVFLHIALPTAVPFVIVGMRLGLGNSIMTVIGAEMLAGGSGLGSIIFRARLFLDFDSMFGGILIIGLLGFLADSSFVLAARRYFSRFMPNEALR